MRSKHSSLPFHSSFSSMLFFVQYCLSLYLCIKKHFVNTSQCLNSPCPIHVTHMSYLTYLCNCYTSNLHSISFFLTNIKLCLHTCMFNSHKLVVYGRESIGFIMTRLDIQKRQDAMNHFPCIVQKISYVKPLHAKAQCD